MGRRVREEGEAEVEAVEEMEEMEEMGEEEVIESREAMEATGRLMGAPSRSISSPPSTDPSAPSDEEIDYLGKA
jgi:hypothetical protein